MNDGYEDGGQTADDFPPEALAAIGRQVHWLLESGMGVAPATRDELAAGIEARADDAEMEGFERMREQCLEDAGMLRDCPPFAIAEEEHVVTMRIGQRVVRRWSTWPSDADLVTAEAVWIVERLVRRTIMGGKTEALRDARRDDVAEAVHARIGEDAARLVGGERDFRLVGTDEGGLALRVEACAEDGLHLPAAVVYRWAREARYRVGVTLAKKKAASGWRAIDTAPKDGRKTWRRGHIRCSGLMRWQKRRWLVLNVSFGAQHESGWHPVKRDFTLKPQPHFQEDAPVAG